MAQSASVTEFPKSIKYIVANEAAERFSYYGLRAVLTTYLVSQFFNPANDPGLQAMAEAKANEQTHFFITLNYFMPVLGALIADWYWGKYKTILWLSLVYCLGNFIMAFFAADLTVFLGGLVLIAIGAGGIKPCVSANVGDQFGPSQAHLITKAFSLFYFSINLGSFIATLLVPVLLRWYGPFVAFGVPGVLMALSAIIFFAGRKQYRRVPPAGFQKENFVAITWYALRHWRSRQPGQGFFDVATRRFSRRSVEGVKAVWRVLAVFAFIPMFWALYDQNGSEWVIQATKMDLHFWGITLLPQQVQAVNPVLILLYIPFFSGIVYPFLERRGIRFDAYRKITAGFVLLALSFLIIYLLQLRIDGGYTPNVGWQMLAYAVLTASEVLISITGLEYAYTQAPARMKSTVMSFWLLTVSFGNLIVSGINANIASNGVLSGLHGANYYLFFLAVIAITALLFAWVFNNPETAPSEPIERSGEF